MQEGERTTPISCIYAIGMFYANVLLYTGVGHCIVYSCIGHSTTFDQINGNQLHTFFIYNNRLIRGWWASRMLMKQQEFQTYLAPTAEVQLIVVERGFIGSMLEDPFEQPEQGW